MTHLRKTTGLLVLTALLAVAPSCSRKSGSGGNREIPTAALNLAPDLTTKPGTTFNVSYTDKVVKIEQRAFLDSIRSISSDNTTFVFDAGDAEASKLKQGSILFVPGIAMRKVDVATEKDGHLVVVTEGAVLVEAFKNADIQWHVPVKFSEAAKMQGATAAEPSIFDPPTVHAAGGVTYSGDDDGWKYTVSANPEPGKVNLSMNVSRSYNGIVVKVDGDGYVQDFDTIASIKIKEGFLDYMYYQNHGMSGVVNFNWEAGKEKGGVEAGEQRIKLPSSFTVPLPIGGVPFALEVSEALLLHPAFTGGSEIARGKFHVNYNGTQGFKLDQGNMNPDGDGSADGSILEHFSLSPVAPVGFVAAVCMPRVELKLGTDSVLTAIKKYAPAGLADGLLEGLKKSPFGKWINQQAADKLKTTGAAYGQMVVSTSTIAAGAGSLVPCQRAQLIITISVGANATVLGKEKANVSKEIFKQTKEITVPPLKACEV
jgi:hypothetical protein